MRALCVYLCIFSVLRAAEEEPANKATPVSLGVHLSHVIQVAHMARAAVGSSKIVKIKAVSPHELLLTGVKPGRTMVRVWTKNGEESSYEVTVLPHELFDRFRGKGRNEVVKISLEFLELNNAFNEKLGIRWPEAIKFAGEGLFSGSGSGTSGLNYTMSFSSAEGLIQHLMKEGWAKRLAHPELYVRLGEVASFHSGGEVPISTAYESHGRYLRRIEWKAFGLTAKVRPQSSDKLHIHSDIQMEISELNQSAGVEGIPALVKRKVETKMNSLDGETVILSGFVRQAAASEKQGIPILSSIPLIGGLFFASTIDEHNETEILMAITISLSDPAGDREKMEKFKEGFHATGG